MLIFQQQKNMGLDFSYIFLLHVYLGTCLKEYQNGPLEAKIQKRQRAVPHPL